MNARALVTATIASFALSLAALACSPAQPSASSAAPPSVDVAAPLRGVADRGADPAVVLLDVDGQGSCAGALLAPDVVLTARRCVALVHGDAQCPATGAQIAGMRDLTTIRVLVGEEVASATERARVRAAVVPDTDELCGADIALLALDATIDEIEPLAVHPTGAAVGDHVRSVGYRAAQKVVRDHVAVAATSAREIALAEAPCDTPPGGPAIEEATGQVVGVFSRSGPACASADGYDVDTRVDAFAPLVQAALAAGAPSTSTHRAKPRKSPVDLGATCNAGAECAAGACVAYADSQYCTRSCGPVDPCPSKTRCMASEQGARVCVAP
jgi:hypothetical protein